MLVIYFNPATTITSGEWSNPPSEFLKMIDNNKNKSMANELGIGFSPLTENVYLGKKNKSKRMWVGQKKDITEEFIDVMFQYLPTDEVREIVTEKENGEVTRNFFIHAKNDKKSLQYTIKFLEKELKKCKK